MEELWTAVPNFPRYEISSKGRIRHATGRYAGFIKPPIQPGVYMIYDWNDETKRNDLFYLTVTINGDSDERQRQAE